MDEPRDKEQLEDLAVPERETEDVKGGALNAYITAVRGEKQGKFQGSVTEKG